MAHGQGEVEIDFGAFPGSHEASAIVTGQSYIQDTSKASSFLMGDDTTADHTAKDHRYAAMFIGLTCGTPVPNDGFTIHARSRERMQGSFKVRWVWTD